MTAKTNNDFRRSPSASAGGRDPAARRSANREKTKKAENGVAETGKKARSARSDAEIEKKKSRAGAVEEKPAGKRKHGTSGESGAGRGASNAPEAKAAGKKKTGGKHAAGEKTTAKKTAAKKVTPKKATAKKADTGKTKSNARHASKATSSEKASERRRRQGGARAERTVAAKDGGRASGAKVKSARKGGDAGANKKRRRGKDDIFMEKKARVKSSKSGGEPPKRRRRPIGALNACLLIGIAMLVALGVRQQRTYAEFSRMREVVDQQTFYQGTTVEGVDVSNMTLSDAMDYWRERVEARYANRTVALDNGDTVTAGEVGYSSDYESVLTAAWSAGRSGSLEQRYRTATARRENPVAYTINRSDYDPDALEEYVRTVALEVDQPAVDADIDSFDATNYSFTFRQSKEGQKLDTDALKQSIVQAIAAGGGDVALQVSAVQPQITTEEVESRYGLIDYAITNANSSSRDRLKNIKLALSILNGTRVAPGETFSFNAAVGERKTSRGFRKAPAYSGGEVTEQVGGGICQVSTTLFNAAVKADMEILERHNHSLTVSYVDRGKDATVNWGNQDFKFKNTSEDDIYICCYLTDDNRVRFGIFGRLLPNGEKITLDSVTTETKEYETEYEKSPLLAPGETYVLQPGRKGYKAEAYKVRWDANGNQISKELLCKSFYQKKNEIIQYGA